MVTVVLRHPVRYPFGFDNVYRMGAVLDVPEEDAERLREMGVLVDEAPEPATVHANETEAADEQSVVDVPTDRQFGPLPKKTQGINAWREYARDNDIDVRGLSEKSELMGHIMKVVSNV